MVDKKVNSVEQIWEQFKTEIVNKNRYFAPKNIISLLDNFNMIKMFPENTVLEQYRARIGDFTASDKSQLLAPPKGKASAGRCNPEGISYLYLSSNLETAVAEVRPNPGDLVTVAKIKIDFSKFFSFRVYFQGLNLPSYPNSEDSLKLIEIIDSELASKVTHERKLDYIPFQYISEYIKNRGFNGFVYSSTVGQGMNLVVFDWEDKVEVTEVNLVEIEKINYQLLNK